MAKMEMARFYNAGDKITNRFNYTKSDEDMRVSNCVGYFDMDAPTQGFFDVPREMKTVGGSQFVGLPKEVLDMYGDRGVIMLDKNMTDEEAEAEKFVANSDANARAKGHELWLGHCRKVIETYEAENENRAVRNMARLRPQGFIVHAYKVLGMAIPAVNTLPVPQAIPAPSEDVAAMKKQLAEQGELLQQLLANQTAPPEKSAKGKNA